MTEPTRKRTAVAAPGMGATLLGAGCLVGLLVASRLLGNYLWLHVSGRAVAFLVYLAWMALVLGTGAGVASALVRRLFPPPGAPDQGEGGGGDELAQVKRAASFFQPVTVYFSLFTVLFSLAGMFAAQVLSEGALFHFKIVQLQAMSRSGEPEELKDFLRQVREMQQAEEVVRCVEKLPSLFEHRDESVREAAFDTMAVMGCRMNRSVALLVRDGALMEDRWEPGVVDWMRASVSPLLPRLYRKGTTPRPAVVRAAAWMVDPSLFRFLDSLAGNPAVPDAEFKEAAAGLGNLGDINGAGTLVAALSVRKGAARMAVLRGLQVLGRSQTPDPADEEQSGRILELLDRVLDLAPEYDDAELCAAVQAVWAFQHSGVTSRLTEFFETERAGLVCPRVEVQEVAVAGGGSAAGPPVLFVPGEKLRWTLLNLFADIGGGNSELRAWTAAMVNRGGFDEEVERGLRQLHGQFQRMEDGE